MGILFITHKYPPSVGGMEKQSYELIQGYKKWGLSYSIVYAGTESKVLFFLRLKKRVNTILNDHPDIQIIHLNDGLMAAFFYLLGINSGGKKIVVTFHGLDVVFPLSWYQKQIIPKLFRYDGFICVSEVTRKACLDRGFPQNKLFVVGNGVDDDSQAPVSENSAHWGKVTKPYGIDLSKDLIILAIGRPVQRKGFSWFAREVMPMLDKRFKFVHIGGQEIKTPIWRKYLPNKIGRMADLFMGRPDDSIALCATAKESPENIILAGKVSDEIKEQMIHHALCLVMPNIHVDGDMEGFGLVALEAAIQGKTVLASGIEGITDAIVDGENGYLVASAVPEAWVKKIIELSKNPIPKNLQFRKYTLEHYSREKMVSGYREVFQFLKD